MSHGQGTYGILLHGGCDYSDSLASCCQEDGMPLSLFE